MRILFSESPNPVDKLIGLMTGEDCGHMAIQFGDLVFESNLLGCHPIFYKTWMAKGRKLVHVYNVPTTLEQEQKARERWIELFDGHQYDFFGALYLGLAIFNHRKFGTPIPTRNRWARRDAFFCDEIFQWVNGMPDLPEIDYRLNGMMTPHMVYVNLKSALGRYEIIA